MNVLMCLFVVDFIELLIFGLGVEMDFEEVLLYEDFVFVGCSVELLVS